MTPHLQSRRRLNAQVERQRATKRQSPFVDPSACQSTSWSVRRAGSGRDFTLPHGVGVNSMVLEREKSPRFVDSSGFHWLNNRTRWGTRRAKW